MERDSQRRLEGIRVEILRRQRNLGPDWEYEGGGTFVMDASEYIEMMEDAALEQDLTVEMQEFLRLKAPGDQNLLKKIPFPNHPKK